MIVHITKTYGKNKWANIDKVIFKCGNSVVKNLPAMLEMYEMWVWSRVGNTLDEDMAIHSSILARKISWTVEPGGLWSIGSKSVGHNWSNLHAHTAITIIYAYEFKPGKKDSIDNIINLCDCRGLPKDPTKHMDIISNCWLKIFFKKNTFLWLNQNLKKSNKYLSILHFKNYKSSLRKINWKVKTFNTFLK